MERKIMYLKDKKYELLFAVLLAGILFLYYFLNLKNICVIWELPDEAGYLYNAALFSKTDWSSYAGLGTSYYGYGYSLILVPLFCICESGVELIKAAIFFNYCMVICIYFMQIYVLSKIFNKRNLYEIGVVAFITSFFPYMVVSANKVLCEIYLVFQVWLIAIILYKLVVTQKGIYYAMAAMTAVYIYYIHARALAVTAVVVIVVSVYSLIKRDVKRFLVFLVSFSILYFVGDLIRENIVLSILNANMSDDVEMGNMINSNYILQRIRWLFYAENIKKYITNAGCRLFYIFTSTGLCVIWFFKFIWNSIVDRITEIINWSAEKWLLFYFSGIFGIMFLMCCISGTGMDFAQTFYGRYIEYVLVPVVGIGMLTYLELPNSNKKYVMAGITLLGIISTMYMNYLDDTAVWIDTARIAGFSYWIGKNQDSMAFLYSQTLLLNFLYVVLVEVHKKNNRMRFLAWAIIMLVFVLNNRECIETINRVNSGRSSEIEVAEFLTDQTETIYFVNREYSYKWNCSRMQAFLFRKPMIILSTDDYENHIGENSYIIAYANTNTCEELEQKYTLVLENETYCVYEKNSGNLTGF